LAKITLASYEKTLRLFHLYLYKEIKINELDKVKTSHIRHYIAYLKARGIFQAEYRKIKYASK